MERPLGPQRALRGRRGECEVLGGLLKGQLALLLSDGVVEALAHRPAHVVHADGGQRADARIDCGGAEG